MTEEEKKKHKEQLIELCKVYCHIDYDDDLEILVLMIETALEEMTELIPNFDQYTMTSRQKLLLFVTVKELYDNREKYQKETKTLTNIVSSMLLKEIYRGAVNDRKNKNYS